MAKKNVHNGDYVLVYSDDPSFHNKDNKTAKIEPIVPDKVHLKIRIEKKQRGGKVVTVIFNLPENAAYFSELTKKIKNHCGTGGTFKDNQIEIQGDHQDKIKNFLQTLGFNLR